MDFTNSITSPCGSLEVVISFDTTGSMYSWLDELRGRVQDLIQRLQADIPGIRIAVFAHGDYCDKLVYVTKWIDFTGDVVKLCDFVKNVERTGGGDAPECYELVLRQVRTELLWTPGSRRVLVMIGDNVPHEPREACNKDNIDWKVEVKALAQMAVTIYGVQCGQFGGAVKFYEAISMATGGKHLQLAEFDSLFHTLMAVCYREVNDTTMLANYEKEVRAKCAGGTIAADIDAIFTKFRSDSVDISVSSPVKTVKSVMPFSARKKTMLTEISPTGFDKMSLTGHVKMAAGRKTKNNKTTPKKKKPNFDKFKVRNLPLLKRENVPENNFNMRSLRWSPWTLAMACSGDYCKQNTSMWEQRGGPGYRLKMLPLPKSFPAGTRGMPALFEVSAQGRDTFKKRYAVFSAFSSCCFGVKNWEQRLLGAAISQVDLVVNSGGRVYIRFCLMTSKHLMVTSQKNIKRYDYAWKKVRNVRQEPRDLIKGDLVMSRSS